MALILLGGAVADIRGSVAGNTYARNSSGNYVRNRTKPVYPASEAQQTAAANMSTIVASWGNDLTIAQREAWNALAARTNRRNKLGQSITVSGFNLYTRSNLLLLLTGQALVTAPPVNPEIPAPSLTLAHLAATGVQVTDIGGWDETVSAFLLISISPALRQTINFYKGPFVSRAPWGSAFIAAVPALIDPTADLFINTRKYYKFVAVAADGGASADITFRADIGAVA